MRGATGDRSRRALARGSPFRRRLALAVGFDFALGGILIAVLYTLLTLWEGRPLEPEDLTGPLWGVAFVGIYYVGFLYAPVLVLAAGIAGGRPFARALAIRLAAFLVPAAVVAAHDVYVWGHRGWRALPDEFVVPLLAGIVSTAAAEVAFHRRPRPPGGAEPAGAGAGGPDRRRRGRQRTRRPSAIRSRPSATTKMNESSIRPRS